MGIYIDRHARTQVDIHQTHIHTEKTSWRKIKLIAVTYIHTYIHMYSTYGRPSVHTVVHVHTRHTQMRVRTNESSYVLKYTCIHTYIGTYIRNVMCVLMFVVRSYKGGVTYKRAFVRSYIKLEKVKRHADSRGDYILTDRLTYTNTYR